MEPFRLISNGLCVQMPKGQHRDTLYRHGLAAFSTQREKGLTQKCTWMALKAVCQAVQGSLHLVGASFGRGRREISIPRLSLSHWEIHKLTFDFGKSWEREGQLLGETSQCSMHLGHHPGNLPLAWQTLLILFSLRSSGCFLMAFKGYFSAESQCALFSPFPDSKKDALQEAPKGAKCNKQPQCRRAIVSQDSDTQQL